MHSSGISAKPKITAIMAVTLNGLLTRGDEPKASVWTSSDDAKFFKDKLQRAEAVVMGVTTFLAEEPPKQPKQTNRLTIVLAHSPDNFIEYEKKGVREFWSLSAPEVTRELSDRGYHDITLIGGGKVNAQFFSAGLVDELYLTVEPKIFGKGRPLVDSAEMFEQDFVLESYEKLNENGTILLHYKKR